jgi:hypothetical protein
MNIHACRRKIRYATVAAARAGHAGMSYYACAACGGWHVTTPSWQRSLLRALRRALHTLPLTHGAAGDPPTGRHTVVHRMKQAGAPSL